jgi:hypothetical protein
MQLLPTKKPRSAYAHYLSSLDRGEADLRVLIFLYFIKKIFIVFLYRIL